MSEININEFTITSKKIKGTGALYSHKVSKGTLKNHPSTWYCKEIAEPALAKIEILAQEFFRILSPHQPQTRIAKNFTTGTYYILSEKVSGFKHLPRDQAERFRNNHYKGLGKIMVGSMFLQETDLKNGNVGIDKQNRVIKIDGDLCFSEDRYPGEYKLTARAIGALPKPVDFHAYNWLDLIQEGTKQNSSRIVDEELGNSSQYRVEVNHTIFQICLLPDVFIESFVDTYIPAGGQRYVDLIKSRRDELRINALSNESFRKYCISPEAQEEAKTILLQLKEFKYRDQFIVKPDRRKELEDEFNQNLNFTTKVCEPIISDCNRLLDKINSYRLIPQDQFMDESLDKYKNEIRKHTDNPQKLFEIKDRLSVALNHVAGAKGILKKILTHKLGPTDTLMETTIHNLHIEISKNLCEPEKILAMKPRIEAIFTSVCSQEINAVILAINKYRNKAGFFSVGKNEKANKIETALYNTPIEQRGNVISSSDVNTVQEALATHRYSSCLHEDVYKTKDGKIDTKHAPHLFKKLKQQYPDNHNDLNFEERESRHQIGDETRPTNIL